MNTASTHYSELEDTVVDRTSAVADNFMELRLWLVS